MSEKYVAVKKQLKNSFEIVPTDIQRSIERFRRHKYEYIEYVKNISLENAIQLWCCEWSNRQGFNDKNNKRNFKKLILKLLEENFFLVNYNKNQITIAHISENQPLIISRIKDWQHLSNVEKENMLVCFKSFLSYLYQLSEGSLQIDLAQHVPYLSIVNYKASQWFDFAINDFEIAKEQLKQHPLSYPDAMYHLQQSAEKAFKSFLIFHGIDVENEKDDKGRYVWKTHDLKELFMKCCIYDKVLKEMKEDGYLGELTSYAGNKRYPKGTAGFLKKHDVEKYVDFLYKLLTNIQNRINSYKK